MLTVTEVLAIILIHWFADFVLQTEKQAQGKSKNWSDLLSHTLTYSFVWYIIGNIYFFSKVDIMNLSSYNDNLYGKIMVFYLFTFICHTITDYFTSRLNIKLAPKAVIIKLSNNSLGSDEIIGYSKNANWRKFFNGVGFDQVLHYTQLFLTYIFLKQL